MIRNDRIHRLTTIVMNGCFIPDNTSFKSPAYCNIQIIHCPTIETIPIQIQTAGIPHYYTARVSMSKVVIIMIRMLTTKRSHPRKTSRFTRVEVF